jgi:hypothetical protein
MDNSSVLQVSSCYSDGFAPTAQQMSDKLLGHYELVADRAIAD